MLDFTYPTDAEEYREIARSTARFAEQQLSVTDPDAIDFNRSHFVEMAKLGLTGMSIDEKLGGSGLNNFAIATVISEIAKKQLGPAIYLSVHLMVSKIVTQHGKLSKSDVASLIDGTALAAFCLTEAGAGSDAAALSCLAEEENGALSISGEKIYISSGGEADFYLVFTKERSSKCKDGISAFLVKKDSKGLSFGPRERKMGCEGSPITSVLLSDVKVDESNRIGTPGEGFKIALTGLLGGRVNIAAAACGIAASAIAFATTHLEERKQFGSTLSENQGLRFMVADLLTNLQAAISITRDAAKALDEGRMDTSLVAMSKIFATDAAMRITTDAVQLLGGAGYLREYHVERLMREAKMLQIVEGTNQIQKVIIAKNTFGA